MKKIIIIPFLTTTCFLAMHTAHATCSPNKGFSSVDISMAVGRIVVKPSDTVGQVLKKASFLINPNGSTFTCDNSGGTINATLEQNYPISAIGNGVYSTNIDGIGIRLYREASGNSNFSGYYPYTRSLNRGTVYSLSSGYFVVEIVKTASQTGSGALVPGRYSSYYVTGYQSKPFLTSTVYGNAITIASSSCEIKSNSDKVVQLPTITKAGFTGIGSTQGEQSFDMTILCNGGQNPTDYQQSNTISLSYDYIQDTSNANVLSNVAADSEKASGVGVQLLWNYNGKSDVITKDTKYELGTVKSNQTLQYNVPMTARYYQTAKTVSAGKVRSLATLTINYD